MNNPPELAVPARYPSTTIQCSKCQGTGIYKWGAIVNGKATHEGICFACKGKGFQTKQDEKRNDFYWNHVAFFE